MLLVHELQHQIMNEAVLNISELIIDILTSQGILQIHLQYPNVDELVFVSKREYNYNVYNVIMYACMYVCI